jgi:leader peptidase (prepilin peptidase) / N-methyltransferase
MAALAIHAHYPWVWPLWGAVLGAVLGSFVGCMADRLKTGQGLRYPPSQCPHCHVKLGVWQLIPVLSWLWLRGRCHQCHAPIPLRLLLLEVAGAVLGAALVAGLLP